MQVLLAQQLATSTVTPLSQTPNILSIAIHWPASRRGWALLGPSSGLVLTLRNVEQVVGLRRPRMCTEDPGSLQQVAPYHTFRLILPVLSILRGLKEAPCWLHTHAAEQVGYTSPRNPGETVALLSFCSSRRAPGMSLSECLVYHRIRYTATFVVRSVMTYVP